jgi:hypothetical protein
MVKCGVLFEVRTELSTGLSLIDYWTRTTAEELNLILVRYNYSSGERIKLKADFSSYISRSDVRVQIYIMTTNLTERKTGKKNLYDRKKNIGK